MPRYVHLIPDFVRVLNAIFEGARLDVVFIDTGKTNTINFPVWRDVEASVSANEGQKSADCCVIQLTGPGNNESDNKMISPVPIIDRHKRFMSLRSAHSGNVSYTIIFDRTSPPRNKEWRKLETLIK